MADRFDIRAMREHDASAVAGMWAEMASQHTRYDRQGWDFSADAVEKFRQYVVGQIPQKQAVVLAAVDEQDQPVGFLVGSVRENPPTMTVRMGAVITDLFVGRACRGQGVGKRLVEAAVERFRQLGAKDLSLVVATGNETAWEMYKKMGMHTVAYRMYKRI